MKKILKLTLLVTLLTNLLTAETIFDLSQQHFANSLARKGVGARYNLPKVYVSTALQYANGQYWVINASSQNFQVEIKNAIDDWSVSYDMSYYLYNNHHPMRLTDATGKTFTVSFAYNKIYVNSKVIYTSSSYLEERTSAIVTLTKMGNKIQVSVAGYTNALYDTNFGRLKFVTIDAQSDEYGKDTLNGLTISH